VERLRRKQVLSLGINTKRGLSMRNMLVASSALFLAIMIPAQAARTLTDEERSKLAPAIAALGCSGGKLEFDDGKFEVDDATCSDGQTYDLQFDANFRLIKKELEGKEPED
jgi:hypothetical protein